MHASTAALYLGKARAFTEMEDHLLRLKSDAHIAGDARAVAIYASLIEDARRFADEANAAGDQGVMA